MDNAPAWIQPVVKAMPLKYLADAMRSMSWSRAFALWVGALGHARPGRRDRSCSSRSRCASSVGSDAQREPLAYSDARVARPCPDGARLRRGLRHGDRCSSIRGAVRLLRRAHHAPVASCSCEPSRAPTVPLRATAATCSRRRLHVQLPDLLRHGPEPRRHLSCLEVADLPELRQAHARRACKRARRAARQEPYRLRDSSRAGVSAKARAPQRRGGRKH